METEFQLNGDAAYTVSPPSLTLAPTSFPMVGSSFQICCLSQGLFPPAVHLCLINILLMLRLCFGNLIRNFWIRCYEVLQNQMSPFSIWNTTRSNKLIISLIPVTLMQQKKISRTISHLFSCHQRRAQILAFYWNFISV